MTNTAYYPKRWTAGIADADYNRHQPHLVSVNDRAATREALIQAIKMRGVQFSERSTWSAHKIKPANTEVDWAYTKIAIHHAGRDAQCLAPVERMHNIQHGHQNFNHWGDIGYHFGIGCGGEVFEGADIRHKGSHLYNFNSGAIGIVLLQNLSEPEDGHDPAAFGLGILKKLGLLETPNIPLLQVNATKKLIEAIREFFNIDQLGGHSEFPRQETKYGRLCPGRYGLQLVRELRKWSALEKPHGS